eukprot:597095-Amphidinium_carterae.2
MLPNPKSAPFLEGHQMWRVALSAKTSFRLGVGCMLKQSQLRLSSMYCCQIVGSLSLSAQMDTAIKKCPSYTVFGPLWLHLQILGWGKSGISLGKTVVPMRKGFKAGLTFQVTEHDCSLAKHPSTTLVQLGHALPPALPARRQG